MEDLYEEDYIDIKFKYEFESYIGEIEGSRYIQDIKAYIIKTDEYGNNEMVIGEGIIKILLLEQAINDIMLNPNICIFERMTILPEYRGLGIGAKFVKDRYNFFSSACGLIVMQPYPLQLEAVGPDGRTNEFERMMNYDKMEQNIRKATKSLKDYYKSIGYISVKGYKDLMFLVPGLRNIKLESINMNEMIVAHKEKEL